MRRSASRASRSRNPRSELFLARQAGVRRSGFLRLDPRLRRGRSPKAPAFAVATAPVSRAGTRPATANACSVSDRTVEALITAGVGLVVVIAVRMLLGIAIGRYEQRLTAKDPALAARRRTTLGFLRKVVVALVAGIAIWKVLSLYPSTDQLVNALLASSAVLAIFVGLAFNTPLSNLGSGMLVAFAQPLRIGDRVTVGEQTGFVEEMDLLYTTLVTDDARRVFIPNSQLTATMIVNRTIRDPRRIVSASLPVRLGAPIDEARTAAVKALEGVDGIHRGESKVLVGDVTGNAVWLTAMASAPLDADVIQLGSDLREVLLGALGDAGYLASSA